MASPLPISVSTSKLRRIRSAATKTILYEASQQSNVLSMVCSHLNVLTLRVDALISILSQGQHYQAPNPCAGNTFNFDPTVAEFNLFANQPSTSDGQADASFDSCGDSRDMVIHSSSELDDLSAYFGRLEATLEGEESSIAFANLVRSWAKVEAMSEEQLRPLTAGPLDLRSSGVSLEASGGAKNEETTDECEHDTSEHKFASSPNVLMARWRGALCMGDLLAHFRKYGHCEEIDWYEEGEFNVVLPRFENTAEVIAVRQVHLHSVSNYRSKRIRVFIG